jgi:NTP pyrophosphatase (non-canonical NTP hydrolase)
MYKAVGKQVLYSFAEGGNQHIADASNDANAELLASALNGRSSEFIPLALVTCSPLFHGDMVSDDKFRNVINGCILQLNELDKVKKSLFYGRDNNLIADGDNDVSDMPSRIGSDSAIAIDIIHAILGKATEAGELLEALRSYYNGDPIDWVNIIEEVGDGFWYDALLANRGNFTFERAQSLIISKLAARFPDKFAAHNANNRNLEAERSILEGNNPPTPDLGGDTEPIPHKIYPALDLAPTPAASGPEAVEAVKEGSEAAFEAVESVGKTGVDAPATRGGLGSELAKSPAARTRPFPDEHLAHQTVRPEDLED